MDHDGILTSNFSLKLSDGLQEGLALNISNRTTDLDNGYGIFILRPGGVESGLDLIGDVGNHLYGASAVIPVPLFVQDGPVYFSRSHIGIAIQTFVDKPLIMSQIQVCLRAVIRDEHLAMLNGIHGTGIHIDIGIKLLHGHMIPSGLEQSAQGGCRDPLSQTGNHTSGHKYIFYHTQTPFLLLTACPIV